MASRNTRSGVLYYLSLGFDDIEIADFLGLHIKTIANHRCDIYNSEIRKKYGTTFNGKRFPYFKMHSFEEMDYGEPDLIFYDPKDLKGDEKLIFQNNCKL